MAINGKYKTALGDLPAHFVIEQYSVDRMTGVRGRLAVYLDAKQRSAHKAAVAAGFELEARIKSCNEAFTAAKANYESAKLKLDRALSTAAAKDRDKAYQASEDARQAFQTLDVEHDAEHYALVRANTEQAKIAEANKPRAYLEFNAPATAIPIEPNGSVSLDAIYAWLDSADLNGGKAA